MNLLYVLPPSFVLLFCAVNGARKEDFKECPYPEYLKPHCVCKEFGPFAMTFCSKMTSANDLVAPIKVLKDFDIMSFTISESSLNFIPENIFENTTFQKIHLRESNILSLSDTDVAFKGLEHRLQEFRATGVEFVTKWEWSQIKNLQCLKSIDINNVSMISLDHEFPKLKSLGTLGIIRAKLSHIVPHAFKALSNLRLLVLRDNDISSMKRSMFPIPALKLRHLDLSSNNLASLPKDMFSEMPNLQELLINKNKFVTLTEETFSVVFKKTMELVVAGNKIKCDCKMRWLVGHQIPHYFDGTCYEPEKIQNKSLRLLKSEELMCE